MNQPLVQFPERRLLRTYAFDPMSSRLSGRFLVLSVPFETDLRPGPDGQLLQVVDYDAARDKWYEPVDLNDPAVLAQDGLRPLDSDPRTHQQICYAVAMGVIERFERFLGRRFRFRGDRKLRLVPHAFEGRNAFFDPERRAVLFGYYHAEEKNPGANLPGQLIFTCLSSDIIAHEVTHALVHRIRRYFNEATNPDVFAWHEAFADLVALFQHFAYRNVVSEAIQAGSCDLGCSNGLLELAKEFGESTGRGEALRKAIGTERTPDAFRSATEPHARGACFVAAVFDAYLDAYRGAIADLVRIATGGSGILPPGQLPPDLVSRATDEAVKCADRMLGMVVRALDYLPVVDVTFGDVVRAIVTADRRLFPDDAANLRGLLIEAMRRRGIYPGWVASLTDDALVWPMPGTPLNLNNPAVTFDFRDLILSATMDLDPEGEAGQYEEAEKAHDAAQQLYSRFSAWANRHALEIGLLPEGEAIGLAGIHVAFRKAEDNQPRPELVIQLIQRRPELEDQSLDVGNRTKFRAATTLIARIDGTVEYVIAKPLPYSDDRLAGLPDDHVARTYHQAGEARLKALRDWIDKVEGSDALSPWMPQPALQRLDFAALHGEMMQRQASR